MMSCSQEAVQQSRARQYVRSPLRHHFVTIAATNATTKMSRLARLPKTTCVCCCSVRMFGQGGRFYSALLAARLARLPKTTCVCCCSGCMFGQGGRFYSALLAVWKRPRASLEAAKASGATRSASADGSRRLVWRLSGGVWRVQKPS